MVKDWKALQTPLRYGGKGSKILVTTRSNKAASIMQSGYIHQLKQLHEDHSWQVFAKHAFQDENSKLYSELKEISMKIVGKCKGLPLALETLGSLLGTKSSVSEWEAVLTSEIWDIPIEDSKIIPALLLSYYHLHSHLKRCFAYCALFPKDHKFDKESLILLWMAQNFLQCSQRNKSPEEVGEEYFNDLLSRSFFQLGPDIYSKTYYVMHDLLNDLAKYISGEVSFRLGVDRAERVPKKIRHFSTVVDPVQYQNSLCDAKGLRTFIFIRGHCGMSMQELISNFKFLRLLSLPQCYNIRKVPDTIGDLIHLRALDLSSTFIKEVPHTIGHLIHLRSLQLSDTLINEVPHTIGNLIHLHLLDLSNTDIEEVPHTIGNLIHLRSLDLSATKIERLPNSMSSLCNLQVLKLNMCLYLKKLHSNFHELTNLRRLEFMGTIFKKSPLLSGKLKNVQIWMSGFEVGKSSESNIQQLGELHLHKHLLIQNVENVVNPHEALEVDLKNKTHIIELRLEWDLMRNIDDTRKEREVLENLQPSNHLKQLSIDGYGGTEFPRWLSDNSLSNVVSLSLSNCKYCQSLPSLGILTFLKHLTIDGLHHIVKINADFYGNNSFSFPSLKMLDISNNKELEEWQCMTGAFPSLQSLYVRNCPKLKEHLPEQLSHLKNLTIECCEQLVASILSVVEIEGVNMEPSSSEIIGALVSETPLEYLRIYCCPGINIPINHCYHSLVKLNISHGCDSLTTFPLDLFPKLCDLCLEKCDNLRMISQGKKPHRDLNSLRIKKCSEFESFPSKGLSAPQLERFWIEELEKLKSMPKHMSTLLPSLDDMFINGCPGMELSDECLPSNLKEMRLWNCSKQLVASLKGALGTNPSLKFLHIYNVDVALFPSEGLLPPCLTDLFIQDCSNLKKLDYRGLCHLPFLEVLGLRNCPILQCLPEEGLPDSISQLIIEDCPLLKQRCKKQEGEDWKKIAHIDSIWVDDEFVEENP